MPLSSSLRALICCLALLAAFGARGDPTYAWRGSISAPEAYPVEVYEGALIAKGYAYPFSPIWGLIHTGWGEPGGVMSLGDSPHALPHTLRITWYSVQEQVFYAGEWPLDAAALAEAWRAGQVNPLTGKREPYSTLLVGLAPKGKVTLWAHGDTRQIQLASFRASTITLTPQQAREDFQFFFRDAYRQAVHAEGTLYAPPLLARLKREGWPDPARYDAYEARHPWQFDGTGLGPQGASMIYHEAFNGDRDNVVPQALSDAPDPRPLPRRIQAVWHDAGGREWVATLTVAFDDIARAVGAPGAATDIRLRIETHPDGPHLYAVTARQTQRIPLQQGEVVTD